MAPRRRAPPKKKQQEDSKEPQQHDQPQQQEQQEGGAAPSDAQHAPEQAAPPAQEHQEGQPQQQEQPQPQQQQQQQHEQAQEQPQQEQDGQPAHSAQEEAKPAPKAAPRSRSGGRKQQQQKKQPDDAEPAAEGEQKQDGEPSAKAEQKTRGGARARTTRAKPAPAQPQGVTKRSTRQPAKKEVPVEEAQKAAPSRSRMRAPAAPKASPARKPAARSRAPSTKKSDAQKDKAEEDAQPASARKAAPSRSRSRAAQPKKEATPATASRSRSRAAAPEKKEAAPAAPSRSRSRAAPASRSGSRSGGSRSRAAAPRQRAAPAPSRSRKRAAPAEKKEDETAAEGKEEEQQEGQQEGEGAEGEEQPQPKRQAGRRAPSRSGTRRPSGSGASRRGGAKADTSKQQSPARKRKADDAEVPAEPTSEKDVEQDASRPAKRQRVAKAPKGAAPTADSEAMAAQQMLSKVPAAEVFVWGSNPFGGLGLGEEETLKFRPTQVPVPNVLFAEVVCGGMHTVALSTTGEVWTWGVNDEGALGRKTLGTAWEAYPDSEKADEKVPGRAVLPDGVRMVEIAAGDGFTVARTPSGAVYGCGTFKDDVGGLSGFTDSVKVQSLMAPLYEPSDPKEQAVKLVAGARHCAILTKNGLVLTWGIGGQGQLGRLPAFDAHSVPPVSELFVPKAVPPNKIPIRSTSIATIATGAYSTFVISKAGDVAAWGLNNSCQLAINKGDEQNNLVWEPTKVTSISKVAAIKGGEQHTLILGKDGRLYSCGAPTYGMLGREGLDVNNANDKYFEPKPVHGFEQMPERGKAVTQIEAGTNISACTQEDGTAWLWGSQVNYQLAKGDTDEDAVVPEKLKRAKTFGFRKIYTISFGGQHAALLAGPQEEPPAPAPAPAPAAPATAAAPAENGGAGPSGTAAAPAAQGEPPSTAADGATATAAAAAPAPPAQPAPPAAPEQPEQPQQPQQQEQQQEQQQQQPSAPAAPSGPTEGENAESANPSQSAIDAAMAWAQQMMNQGGTGALMGNAGAAQQPQGGMQQQPQQ